MAIFLLKKFLILLKYFVVVCDFSKLLMTPLNWHNWISVDFFFTNEYKNDHDKKVTSVLRSDRKLSGGKFMHENENCTSSLFLEEILERRSSERHKWNFKNLQITGTLAN